MYGVNMTYVYGPYIHSKSAVEIRRIYAAYTRVYAPNISVKQIGFGKPMNSKLLRPRFGIYLELDGPRSQTFQTICFKKLK